jgi:hypothetical protein
VELAATASPRRRHRTQDSVRPRCDGLMGYSRPQALGCKDPRGLVNIGLTMFFFFGLALPMYG